MNKLIHCWTALMCEPWLITPEMHAKLQQIVLAHIAGGEIEKAQHEMAAAMPAKPVNRQFEVIDRTAVIPVEGVIGRKFSSMLQESGVVSIDVLERLLMVAAEDDEIDCIVMAFDSPGGRSSGVPEVGQTIHRINETMKPVISLADGMCGSAAYWLASQTCHITAIGSADVGSIGVYAAVLDQRRAMESQGYQVDVFKNAGATYKGMGIPGTSLTPEQRDLLQMRVDRMGEQFKEVVRQGRERPIADDAMRGQSFAAEDALKNGLIDRVGSYADVLSDAAAYGKMKRSMKRG
ncbi:MAG TPA: S49 family peptidase [Pirellulales bacterium]|nr:S49 family peptidase [Pirellulales bacterium]